MIFVGVVIIVGVLVFAASCAHFVHRQAVLIAERTKTATERHQQLQRQDQQALEAFLDAVLSGQKLGDALPEFLKTRAALMPEAQERSGAWSPDDATRVLESTMQREAESIGRSLFLPMFLTSVAIIALTVVGASTMYSYLESPSSYRSSPAAPANTQPYDPFAIDPFGGNSGGTQ